MQCRALIYYYVHCTLSRARNSVKCFSSLPFGKLMRTERELLQTVSSVAEYILHRNQMTYIFPQTIPIPPHSIVSILVSIGLYTKHLYPLHIVCCLLQRYKIYILHIHSVNAMT